MHYSTVAWHSFFLHLITVADLKKNKVDPLIRVST